MLIYLSFNSIIDLLSVMDDPDILTLSAFNSIIDLQNKRLWDQALGSNAFNSIIDLQVSEMYKGVSPVPVTFNSIIDLPIRHVESILISFFLGSFFTILVLFHRRESSITDQRLK